MAAACRAASAVSRESGSTRNLKGGSPGWIAAIILSSTLTALPYPFLWARDIPTQKASFRLSASARASRESESA